MLFWHPAQVSPAPRSRRPRSLSESDTGGLVRMSLSMDIDIIAHDCNSCSMIEENEPERYSRFKYYLSKIQISFFLKNVFQGTVLKRPHRLNGANISSRTIMTTACSTTTFYRLSWVALDSWTIKTRFLKKSWCPNFLRPNFFSGFSCGRSSRPYADRVQVRNYEILNQVHLLQTSRRWV